MWMCIKMQHSIAPLQGHLNWYKYYLGPKLIQSMAKVVDINEHITCKLTKHNVSIKFD
jgi:hypothetical protein